MLGSLLQNTYIPFGGGPRQTGQAGCRYPNGGVTLPFYITSCLRRSCISCTHLRQLYSSTPRVESLYVVSLSYSLRTLTLHSHCIWPTRPCLSCVGCSTRHAMLMSFTLLTTLPLPKSHTNNSLQASMASNLFVFLRSPRARSSQLTIARSHSLTFSFCLCLLTAVALPNSLLKTSTLGNPVHLGPFVSVRTLADMLDYVAAHECRSTCIQFIEHEKMQGKRSKHG